MIKKLTAAALLTAPALFWATPAQASGTCYNNWGDVTPGGQGSKSACDAIGGRWVEHVAKPKDVVEGEAAGVRFAAPPGVKDGPAGDPAGVRFASPPREEDGHEGDASRATASSQLENPDTYAAPDKQRVAKVSGEKAATEDAKEEPGVEERPE